MNNVAIALEHVHLLNGLDRLDIELLKRRLKLLVVTSGPGRRALDLSPGSSLSTIPDAHVRKSVLLRGLSSGGGASGSVHTLA